MSTVELDWILSSQVCSPIVLPLEEQDDSLPNDMVLLLQNKTMVLNTLAQYRYIFFNFDFGVFLLESFPFSSFRHCFKVYWWNTGNV